MTLDWIWGTIIGAVMLGLSLVAFFYAVMLRRSKGVEVSGMGVFVLLGFGLFAMGSLLFLLGFLQNYN